MNLRIEENPDNQVGQISPRDIITSMRNTPIPPESQKKASIISQIEHGLRLPFSPHLTQTRMELEHFSDLPVAEIQKFTELLVLAVDGVLTSDNTGNFTEPVTDKERDIHPAHQGFTKPIIAKLQELNAQRVPMYVHSNNPAYQNHPFFQSLGIPVINHAAPKPDPQGFMRVIDQYNQYYNKSRKLYPQQCAMVGDNILTDGGCRQIGMKLILVDPIPGKEPFTHNLARAYGRWVKEVHNLGRTTHRR